jgi:CDP-glucose 4,6-dehydratase
VIDPQFWRGRRVLVTGHTGFKGGWLSLWLDLLGARVTGFALEPPTQPSFFETCHVEGVLRDIRGDITEAAAMRRTVRECDPEIVFHLAARTIVRQGYEEPLETYATNVLGTAMVLDACRDARELRAIVCVTTDKCYENREWEWPYREMDRLGGHDPYSSSKACAELVAAAYRRSFFHGTSCGIATARAGNVIGGGDWASDRLLPDLARAAQSGQAAIIRNPMATRPWQHVLEPLSGYLLLAQRLAAEPRAFSEAWNFGPNAGGDQPVSRVVEEAVRLFGGRLSAGVEPDGGPHEAGRLMLDSSKARVRLPWQPRWGWKEALALTVEWYERFFQGREALREISRNQIRAYSAMSTHQTTREQP